jgi:polysaccharide biosynthesis/export protein
MRFSILVFGLLLLIFEAISLPSCAPMPVSSPVTQPTQSTPAAESDYILGPEDVIEVAVWKEPDLSKTVTVRPDGKLSLPLVGDLQAAGLTAIQLKETIKQALTDYVEDASVSVTVQQINSLKIFIQGEVNQPGVYDLKSNFTVLQAVSLAGGFSQWAKKDRIVIFRKEGERVTSIPVNYDKIISGENQTQNVLLKRGDTIVVP